MTSLFSTIVVADSTDINQLNTLDTIGRNSFWVLAFFGLMFFFTLFRERLKSVYSPRKEFGINHVKNNLPLLSQGWRWFADIIDIPDELYLNSVGLDAYCFSKVISLARRWCIFWTIFSTLPLLFIHNSPNKSDKSFETTPSLLPPDSYAWYIHFAYYYVISISLYYFVFKLNAMFISLRQGYLITAAKTNNINSRSIIVQGIPHSMRSGPWLLQFFSNMNIGTVEKVIVFRNFNSLLKIIKRRFNALVKLEHLYETWLKNSSHNEQNQVSGSHELLNVASQASISSSAPPKLPFRKSSSTNISNANNLDSYDFMLFSNTSTAIPNHSPLPHPLFLKLDPSKRPTTFKKCPIGNFLAPVYWFTYNLVHGCPQKLSYYKHDSIDHYFSKFKKYDIQTTQVRQWYENNIDKFDEDYSANYRQELSQFQAESSREFLTEQWIEFQKLSQKLLELTKLDKLQSRSSLSSLENGTVNELDNIVDIEDFQPTSSAIVTFKNTISAQVSAQILMHRVPIVLKCSMAPSYTDLYYANLSFPPIVNYLRYAIVLTGIFFLIIFWNVVVSSLTGLILSTAFLELLPTTTAQFLQSILPPLILNVSVAFLPILFTATAKFQGLQSWSNIEHSVITKYFYFLVLNALILIQVTILSGKVIIDAIYNQKYGDLGDKLASVISVVAPTMVAYVYIQTLVSIPLQISRITTIVTMKLTSIFQSTPRDIGVNLHTAPAIDYGSLVPVPSFIFLLAVIYSVLEPMMMPICALYFLVQSICTKYNFLFIYERRYETGGQMIVNNTTDFTFCALVLYHITAIAYMAAKGPTGLSAGLTPLLVIDAILIYYSNTVLRQRLKFLPGSLISEQSVGSPENEEQAPEVDISNAQAYGDEERMVFGNYNHVLPQHHPDINREYGHPAINGKLSKVWVRTSFD